MSKPLLVHFENREVIEGILRSAGKLWSSSGSKIWLNDVFIQPVHSKIERIYDAHKPD